MFKEIKVNPTTAQKELTSDQFAFRSKTKTNETFINSFEILFPWKAHTKKRKEKKKKTRHFKFKAYIAQTV